MNPGMLDRLVTIQRVTTAKNASGVAVETWADLVSVWAQKEDLSGREFLAQQQGIAPESDTRFVIRYLSGLTSRDRLTLDGATYDILSIAEIGRQEFHKLGTRLRVAA